MIRGSRILITGPASQVTLPITAKLAEANTVFGLARFSNADDVDRMHELGVECLEVDLATDSLDSVPGDVDYVLAFANVKSFDGSFDYDLAANVEGVGRLMSRCRRARAFLYCSSTAVYQPAGHRRFKESDPLGDNHRVLMPTYSICKIAAEAMVRFGAREWNLPATIARLNVPYGDHGGWPAIHLDMMLAGMPIDVHVDKPSLYNPLHEDDYVGHVARLLEIASVPATTLNWAGSETVSLEEWCEYLGSLAGVEPTFRYTERALSGVAVDVTRMHQLLGPTRVAWRDGMRRMVAARHPELDLRA